MVSTYPRLNLGCGTSYVEGWTNADIVESETITPDVLLAPEIWVWPFDDGSMTHVYAGHVLQHVPWDRVQWVLDEIRRVLEPGGELLVVGPDVYRALDWQNDYDAPVLQNILENDQPAEEGARIQWNCDPDRLMRALRTAGFDVVVPLDVDPEVLDLWPVVSFVPWQCCVHALAP